MNKRDEEKQIIFESLKEALLILMEKKDFSRITVKELVSKAGVARSTFYRYFPNKIDLVRFLIHDALINFDKKYAPKTIEERFESPYMDEVRNYVQQYKNPIKSIYKSGLSYLYLEELNKHLISLKPYKLTMKEKIYLYGLAGAQYNIIYNGFIDAI
ncbi:TetR/AcrR family transcriptional regulator [Companilactobacillus huachuanensis]|uniref:TetR/AcrR family transcriptional regulator n=1 Tax=Companilactobacillus huachuanensis TaxID=2559914 RepID=A0ABW1RQA9_9LACO|nr:TetR/AcrR family transcriptional regulator [Companilactobacillus huachuanensis]